MTHTPPLYEQAGLIPVRSASGTVPHYAKEGGDRAICARKAGSPLTGAELDGIERFCFHCTAAAEKLVTDRTVVTEPATPLTTAARALADSIEPGQRNAEIVNLGAEAGLILVHSSNDFDPHYADPAAVIALCRQPIERELDAERMARISVVCGECETAARAIAGARAAAEAAAKTPVTGPRVHRFDSTHEAYNATQWNDEIRDGDVLVIAPEKVVGILNEAWPFALTVRHGELHTLSVPVGDVNDGKYAESARVAAEQARALNAALRGDHDPGAEPTERTKGTAPRHAGHPDAIAALAVLAGMKAAELTDEHDPTEPSDIDVPVRGYVVEPRGHGLVAAYWLERGRARRRDDGWHGPALDALVDRFKDAGWAVEPLRASSLCVFAHRPQPDSAHA